MSGRARTTTEESASTTPTASASAQTRGFGLPPSIAKLRSVLFPVLLLAFENQFDVRAGFGVRDVVDPNPRPAPLVGVARAGVVGGERGDHVPFVAFEKFLQQEGAITDVDFRVGEVGEVEGGAAALFLDE